MQNLKEKGFADTSNNGAGTSSLPEKLVNEITNVGVELNTARKQRKKNPNPFPEYATAEVNIALA